MIAATSYINICVCLSAFKLLFLKSYVSSDFDVHRNWMAITYNLSVKQWYFDSTSEWTLDYPPLFAAFEYLLAIIAHYLNLDQALKLISTPIRTESVIIYQKVTVILSDIVYYYAIYQLCESLRPLFKTKTKKAQDNKKQDKQVDNEAANSTELTKQIKNSNSDYQDVADVLFRPNTTTCIAILLLLQPGLLLVDHIHFQYNGLLSGMLLLSIAHIIKCNYIQGSIWFAILLNFKHIYLYCAPAFGMYLLTSYCMEKAPNQNRFVSFVKRVTALGSVVVLVFLVTYAPFADQKTLTQIIHRLFPFKRGLTHAYWAPNFWSLYNTADKILSTVYKDYIKVNFDIESISRTRTSSSTSGLVQDFEHQYLPQIKPLTTFTLVGASILPIALRFLFLIGKRSPLMFMKCVALTAFSSFMFGWHVHEKAIILVLIVMIPISYADAKLNRTYLRLLLAGTYSLHPLLFQPAEYLTKFTIIVAYYLLSKSHSKSIEKSPHVKLKSDGLYISFMKSFISRLYVLLDNAYILMIILNELYCACVFSRLNYNWNPLARLNKFEFLPLMLTSNICALGIVYSYVELYLDFVLANGNGDMSMCLD